MMTTKILIYYYEEMFQSRTTLGKCIFDDMIVSGCASGIGFTINFTGADINKLQI